MFSSNLFRALLLSFITLGVISCSSETSDDAISSKSGLFANKSGVATLNWLPPTENTDNSTLIDLMEYKIYYGLSADSLTESIVINNAGLTELVIENLNTNIKYYFVITSVNSLNVESIRSNIVSKFVSG
ncbi:hypothetical protein MNBD_GAMMA09-3536 [hydrothermal vent metagenome]|uniref:Fibronectin type-III domain-containing protein n=1 Tax=hydrothermal vent metagenome TaxID=652676 RepID=A0A3B0Y2C4_9ZZZZ